MDDPSSEVNLNESMDESKESGDSFLVMELEALQSIYINEIEVKNDGTTTIVSIDLHPSTADKLEEQYVRMTLQFTLSEEYPYSTPIIKIRNPRGLSDEKLNCITKDLSTIAETKQGNSMLFEMIEAAKDHLTSGNRPSGECAICLYGFGETDVFTKTGCYHYFHSHCLARYNKNFQENSEDYETDPKTKAISNELLCPMCRVPIQFNGHEEEYPPPEASDDTDFIPSSELLKLQQKMSEIYQRQIDKGGIIDVEAEKNKYLLEISNVSTRVNIEEKTDQKIVNEKDDEAATEYKTSDTPDFVSSPNKERKMQNRDQDRKFDYRSRNQNFNVQGDNRKFYRYNQGYNRPNFNSYGNYPRNNYRKQYGDRFEKRNYEKMTVKDEATKSSPFSMDASASSTDLENAEKKDDLSTDLGDDKSETSEQLADKSELSEGRRFNYQNKYSDSRPRYNRGYNRGNYYGNSSNYNGNQRFDRSNYRENNSAQRYRNYDYKNKDADDYNSRRSGNRNVNYKRDDYYSKDKYSENNSHRGYKGGYGRRENYFHEDDSRKNRYMDRDQYPTERDRNFKDKRTTGDGRYRDNSDNYGYNRKFPRNYPKNKFEKHSNESQDMLPENSESVVSSSRTSNDSDIPPPEIAASTHSSEDHKISLQVEETSIKEDIPECVEHCSSSVTDAAVSQVENSLRSLKLNTNLQNSSRTVLNPPPGFANPLKKVIYGLQGANPPPGFQRS